MKIVFKAFSFSIIVGLLSCKPKIQESGIKHTWGDTTRDSNVSVGSCETSPSDTIPKTQKFLAELGKHILFSNPQTFKAGSDLDPKRFCFNVYHDRDYNAVADSLSRNIEFSSEAVKASDDYESVAMIMGHELAHISLRHSSVARHPAYMPTKIFTKMEKEFEQQLVLNQSYSDLGARGNELGGNLYACQEQATPSTVDSKFESLSSIADHATCAVLNYGSEFEDCDGLAKTPEAELKKSYIDLFDANCHNLASSLFENLRQSTLILKKLDVGFIYEVQEEMRKEIAKSPDISKAEASNWQEREADEIGYEFYIRAGFSIKGAQSTYIKFAYMDLSTDVNLKVSKCLSYIDNTSTAKEISEHLHKEFRGTYSHPAPCWRMLHHVYEKRMHGGDIAATKKHYPDNVILQKLWSEAKAELKNTPYPEDEDREW
jgi:hypothetical protein